MVYEEIIKDPIKTLKSLPVKEIVNILKEADDAFFNRNETIFTDDIYDIIKTYLKQKDPKNQYFKSVGAEVYLNKESLPFYMGSLDKIKDNEKELEKWKKTYVGSYVISEKLDGISCMIYKEKEDIKVFTRGDGYEGQNITHILPYLKINVSKIPTKIAIRGELIISKKNWELISHLGANARNVVAGAIHSKTLNEEILTKIDFIAYDIIFPKNKLSISLNTLKTYDIKTVKFIEETDITTEYLSSLLQDWRSKSKYEIDGIVVCHDEVHKLVSGKNPKYAFAFKTILTQEQAEVIVTDVEWNVSKHRLLKPIVKFNEVVLGGVKIKQTTGFNGAYIQNNKIGPGSRIIIIRSGDVIPHIISILSHTSPKMPDQSYEWSGVDVMLKGEAKNKEHDIQIYLHFMKSLAIDGIKEGTLNKLYDAGFDTLPKIVHLSLDEIKKVFKDKSANNIYTSLQKIKNIDCLKLMVSSNVFGRGFGEKKLKLIIDTYSFIITDKEKAKALTINDILKIKGIAEISANQFIEGLIKFYEFNEELGITCKNEIKSEIPMLNKKLEVFKDKTLVFSGFRNKDYEEILQNNGAKITNAITKNTDYLIIKDLDEKSSKKDKAVKLNITIITREDLEKMITI